MTYITFEEFKEILKKSIDETANINEAIEKTVQFIYLKGYEDCSRHLWISSAIPPKVSGNYWCTFGGTNLTGKDYYTTESDAKEIFDDAAEEHVGWQSQNVTAWMPLPEPYKPQQESEEVK